MWSVICHEEYVVDKQEEIKFGDLNPMVAQEGIIKFDEFEYDGGSFRRTDLPGGVVQWQEYHIMKRRGGTAATSRIPMLT